MALPAIGFTAPIISAAIATLKASMPGQVDQFNADPASTVELPEPQSFHRGGQDLLSAFAFPQIEVASVSGTLGPFAIGRAEADHDPRVNVAIWLDAEQGEIPDLYDKIQGLTRCVIECLVPTGAFGGGVQIVEQGGVSWRTDVVPYDPTASSPAEGRSFQKWLGSGLIQFALETVERFT